MSGSSFSTASSFATSPSVAVNDDPPGKRSSTINSLRDDCGKNCFGTNVIPYTAAANSTAVTATTDRGWRTQAVMAQRRSRYIRVWYGSWCVRLA